MKHWVRLVAVGLVGITLAACETLSYRQNEQLARPGRSSKVVVMPIDIELSELSAGGLPEPKADWTAAAKILMTEALDYELSGYFFQKVHAELRANDPQDEKLHHTYGKLYQAVGGTILNHLYLTVRSLPTKQGKLDWTLGPGVAALRERHNADYALYLYVRDSYSSSGRVAVIAVGALLGVGIPGGVQVGYASLVDLRSGDVVWFNRLVRGAGDIRTKSGASETVKFLLTGLPK